MGTWEECFSIRYRENSSLVGIMVVTPLNLYKTEPGATFVWIDMQIFRNFHPNPSFFSSNSILNKFVIRACCICWSRDRKCYSNMACTYFRVLFLAYDGRRRGESPEKLLLNKHVVLSRNYFPWQSAIDKTINLS